jgi:DNA replication protein DnaC
MTLAMLKKLCQTLVLSEFIAHRYESGKLIIALIHLFSHEDLIFPDNMMTVAAIDHIIHHATNIEMESYRKKQCVKKQTLF